MVVLTLNTTEKLILLATMIETDYGKKPTIKGKVYNRYVELSRQAGVEPVTPRRVLDVIKVLAKEGILWITTRSFGRYGRTTLVKLLYNPGELCQGLTEDLLVGEVAERICGDPGAGSGVGHDRQAHTGTT
jgi:Cdc6-like AAA superfamily ATPase